MSDELKKEARLLLNNTKEEYFAGFSTKEDAEKAQRYADLGIRGAKSESTTAQKKKDAEIAREFQGLSNAGESISTAILNQDKPDILTCDVCNTDYLPGYLCRDCFGGGLDESETK